MAPSSSTLRTVGFISTWPVYQGTTIDRHAHALMQGICAAARDEGCRLLLAAGVSPVAERGAWRTVWPVPTDGAEFVPVGPWNTDGLIIVPDDLSDAQSRYVHDLQASGFPVVFTTPEAPGPMVAVDNASGIREAVRHLVGHGHRRIAFIAGKQHRGGDSAERLEAYLRGISEEGLEPDARLVAYGEHRFDGGAAAMYRLLDSAPGFTAFIASNDLSCLGAIEALRESGRSVPDDVAAIGFDDILDARSNRPSLTTVRHPTFALGYESVVTLLARIDGRQANPRVVVPTRLIVRQSCGCGRDQQASTVAPDIRKSDDPSGDELALMAQLMADAAFVEARHSTLDQLEEQCRGIVAALAASISAGDERPLREEVARLLARTEERGEDPHVWQSAVSALYRGSTILLDLAGTQRQGWLIGLLDHARLEISEQVQRQTTSALLEHMDMMTELGLLTARLSSALEATESSAILAEHLPRLGIDRFLVVTYADDDDEDPGATSEVLLSTGLAGDRGGLRFPSREFPPPGLYAEDEPLQLLLLPLRVDEWTTGFVALSTTNLEVPAAIVSNLATAIRGGRLYRQAVDGRRLAEEANQLKGRFLSMVSHELRTPLSVVVGLSDMVVREVRQSGTTSAGMVRDLERMAASAEHLGRLIGDVLDLASSEAGQLRLVRQPLDVCEVLAATVLAGEQMAREKGLEWRATLPTEELWVMGDRTRIRQVVLNLISNAVKFTSVGAVSLDVATGTGPVTISVSDTGPGIPLAEQSLIFDEFHRAGHGARRGPGGLGLGLAISRQLAEHHGGRLDVQSPGRGGVGSTFVFTLPILAPVAVPEPTDMNRRVVVAIADEPAVSSGLPDSTHVEREPALANWLRARGYRVDVVHVGSGGGWATAILDRRPGAVIVDETLASGPAWELTQLLSREPAGREVPVLAYRMHDADRGAVLELNYLSKPLRPSVLVDELIRQIGPAAETRTPRILVVDDDPDILDLHSRVVREAGGEPIGARTGREAMAVLDEIRPDLVLLDLGMPDMDGFDLLEAMRARTATQGIPVIVITGQVLTDEDLDRLNRGVATILSKGVFTVDETIGRIESALEGRRGLGSATQRLVRRAIVFVDGHFAESIGRDDIARHVSISPDYLTDCFHQELGITPIAYLNRRRLREARDLLDRNDDPITAVAMAVGFSDVSHFTRTFHREVGVSPRAYRRRGRG